MINLDNLSEDLKGKRLLITGGSGFFGKNLCEQLNFINSKFNLGMTIYSLGRNKIIQDGVIFVQHDVSRPFSFDLEIDYLIHAATPVVGNEDFHQTMEIIVNGTKNTLDFAFKAGCKKFLLVSSGAVYGEQPQDVLSLTETTTPNGPYYDQLSAYATGKRISEMLALNWSNQFQKNLTIARCFAFSGKYLPLDKHLAIGNFVGDALRGQEINIKGDGTAQRTYMDSEDLVEWLMTILLRGDNQNIYNVGSDQIVTMKELAELIAREVPGTRVNIQNLQSTSGKRSRYIPSIKKAQDQLNLEIRTSLEESLKKMIQFNRG